MSGGHCCRQEKTDRQDRETRQDRQDRQTDRQTDRPKDRQTRETDKTDSTKNGAPAHATWRTPIRLNGRLGRKQAFYVALPVLRATLRYREGPNISHSLPTCMKTYIELNTVSPRLTAKKKCFFFSSQWVIHAQPQGLFHPLEL